MTQTKMDPEIKKLWVEALRSGEYEQGRDMLKDPADNKFCCLGVLCELSGLTYEAANLVPPPEIVAWARLPDADPKVKSVEKNSVAYFNDMGFTFAQIADLIEAQL